MFILANSDVVSILPTKENPWCKVNHSADFESKVALYVCPYNSLFPCCIDSPLQVLAFPDFIKQVSIFIVLFFILRSKAESDQQKNYLKEKSFERVN